MEPRWIGGSCPNIACMPSKNEIANAKVAHLTRHGTEHGVVTGSITIDMAMVRRRKREMVERQVAAHLQTYKASGAELIMGTGRFAWTLLGAQATDQREGFMKALVGENDDRILGFTMIGATAGEVMAAVQTAMMAGLPYSRLANAALAHPTMAEGLSMLFSNTPPRSVQQIPPERAA